MKLPSSILIASMVLAASVGFANSGFAQDRAAPARAVAHPPPNIEESTRYGWAVVLRVDPIYDQTPAGAPAGADPAAADPAAAQDDCVEQAPVQSAPSPPPHQDTRAGGTVIGAIVGGVVGSLFGKGDGRKVATAAGAVAGGVIGHNVAASNDQRAAQGAQFEPVPAPPGANANPRCRDANNNAQRRIVGYDVEYRYGGEVYMARLAYDPGDRMRVKISVVPAE
jgi:uncharacterized protein YcfJ